jgi:tripartite-type tricarboxylate transporter receptor subunit TctC
MGSRTPVRQIGDPSERLNRVPVRRRALCLLAAACCAATGLRPALAAHYPSKPVRLLVGAPPGGPSDFMARLFSDAADASFDQNFVVENRPGASGTLAAEAAARADADGHTLLIAGQGSVLVAPYILPRVNFKPSSFVPVTMLGAGGFVLAVHASLPVSSLGDLMGLIRARPGSVSFGSGGIGSSGHLCSELFAQLSQGKMLHVPYKGDGQAVNDLVGGQIEMMFTAPNVAMPHVKAGKLRALAVTTRERMTAFPDVPTVHEAGLQDFEYLGWTIAFAPAGTPRPVLDALSASWNIARTQGAAKARLDELGMAAPERFFSGESLGAFLSAEDARLDKVIRDADIKIDQ